MLTYIEPCGWCSSSISTLKCPSKSIESYQNSSSSQLSLSLSQNSLKSYQKTAFSTPIIRSTYSHPHDYHSRKRIDELHERLDEIQIRNFLKFINYHLKLNKSEVNLQIDDFISDLSNGQIFLDLIEKFSSTKLPREHGRTRFHSLTNVQHVLDYFKSHQQYIDISPNDILSGNRKQILALLWTIMKYFDFPNFRLINRNCFQEKTLLSSGQDRSVLLNWLNNLLNQCLINQQNLLKDFYIQTWINGYYLSLILKYLVPISENYSTMKSFDYLKQLNTNSCERCFEICLELSNYCFHTSMNINHKDKTEISLLKYFTDLQKNIYQLIQSDHLGKLVQINPYTKQILQTIEQDSSNVINVNEQYLVCIQENRKSDSIEVERLNEQRDKKEVVLDEDIIEEISQILTSNENDQSSQEIISNIDIGTNERENVCLTVEINEPIPNDPVEEIENIRINLPLVEEIDENQFHQLQSEEQTISINDQDKQICEEEENIEQSVPEKIEAESLQPVIFMEEPIEKSSVDTRIEAIEIPSELIVACDKKEVNLSNDTNNEIEITSSDKLEEQIVPFVETELSEKIEQISNIFVENVNNQTDQSIIESSEILTKLPNTKFELSVVKEVHQQQQPPLVSNGYKNPSTYRNKKFSHSPRKFIPNNSHSQSTSVVDKPVARQIPNEITVQTAVTTPVRCSRYSDVVNQSVPSMKKEQTTIVPKKKVIPNEPPKQSIIITEEIRTVPIKQPEPVQLASIQQEQPKKSSNKNKKSKRSNAKKAQPTNIISIIDEQPTISLIVDDPEPVIEVEPTPINNENSNVVRSRRSRRKKTVATKSTTVIEKTPSPNATASNRNLFVVVKECLQDRKLIAFKCVIILVCLCFSIIILVLSYK